MGMAVMKHVGVNVAADVLMYVAMTGSEAGLVAVSADDLSMHSSQKGQTIDMTPNLPAC